MNTGTTNNTIAGFRLSAQQEWVWQHQHRTAGAPFRALCVVKISGPLVLERLREAAQEVIARHEILRTVFHRQAGLKLPFQVIRETSDPSWANLDISELSPTEQRAKLDELFRQEQERPLNPEQGPILHGIAAKLGGDNHAMLISLPALCSDSQTLRNVVAEIGHRASSSAESSGDIMQYADMVEWQNDLLQSDETKAGRDFWRNHCRKIDPAWLGSVTLPLEADSEPAAFTPSVVSTVVDSGLVSRMHSMCSERGVSAADLVLACWQVLLWRLLGQQPNITIGCAFDGRKYAELENACGLFSKYLPLHSQFDAGLPFSTLLTAVKESVTEAHEWQESFAWNQIEAFANRDIMLPFLFEYEERAGSKRYGELTISLLRQYVCSDRFKLKLSCWRQDSRLGLELHYDAARLDAATVERWAKQFQTLLAGAVNDPETAVSRLPMLNQAERQQLLMEWNQTAADFPERQCWHELLEAQAERTPTRPAVRFGDQQLSYVELNERANQLAHYLRRLGVGPDGLVGLCVERSAEMLVAVLGILKAGGAYVPLNADNPKPRLAQQLAGAVALITEQKLLAQMPEIAGKILCLDSDPAPWANEPKSNPRVNTTPENLVYVIYTSGSTGVPKGVAVRHRNLVNYSWFIGQLLQLEKDQEGLQFGTVSTISADLGNTCIYPALIFGGCLHIISYEVATDSLRFARYLEQHPVDVLKIVPSHLSALINSVEGKQILPRRYLILGGEKLSWELVEKIHGLGGSCEIVNHYGPTETTVGSLTLKLNQYQPKKKSHSVPLGRPIANTQVYILDQHLQPVPVGVVGELYISGAGVTAGYLNQAERTAERFLANPFVEDSQSKMYRTGDLARYLPGGEIEFLGRGDDQVKIRGFRIELGEIESVLTQHPAVKQAVVLAQEDERGDKRLVAYVVSHREKTASPDELRDYLEQHLPDYMIPAALVILAKLPLTANGKIDRQALPAPEKAQSQQKPYLAPRTAMEEIVASIWAEVLHRQPISADDNFFHLGGHSLLATQVISRLRRILNIDLPLRCMFESPTVNQLAAHIDRSRVEEEVPPPIVRVPRGQPLPLSFAQQRLWFLDQFEPNDPLYNIPRALRMTGTLNVEALEASLDEIIQRHESQRTTFTTEIGQPVQVIAPSSTIRLSLDDLSNFPENQREMEARRLAGEEALLPFDLAQGPLLRARLLRLAPDDHILLLTMHHIVSDAWSAGVFLQELGVLYEAFSARKPSPLPELPIQYADYAAWQRQWLQGRVLQKQLSYWREHLKGAPPVLQLPNDRPRPEVRSFRGNHQSFALPGDLSNDLKKLSQQQGVTIFMTLLAAFQTLLSRYSGQEQIVVGTDVANRTTLETERLIGFFINLLPLRTDLSGNPTFHELLARVRNAALGAYAHQDIPFEKLVEELQPERSLSHNPIVQVLFVMQNIPRLQRELTGLKVSSFEMPVTRSKFDVAVFMVEREDGLIGHWISSTDLFEPATIQRMANHFERLLRSIVEDPAARVSTLEFLSDEEKQQRSAEKQQRKQLRVKKLRSVEPRAVPLSQRSGDGIE